MTVATAQSKVATLKAALVGYVSEITHDDSTTQTVLQAQANLALDNWENASNAAANLAASAANSYSSGVGMSVTKRQVAEAESTANGYMEDFRRACGLGGVEVASFEDQGIALWDMSRVAND